VVRTGVWELSLACLRTRLSAKDGGSARFRSIVDRRWAVFIGEMRQDGGIGWAAWEEDRQAQSQEGGGGVIVRQRLLFVASSSLERDSLDTRLRRARQRLAAIPHPKSILCS